MDKALKEQRTLMNLHFGNREFFAPKEATLVEVEREHRKATIEWIGYVDSDSKNTNTASESLAAEDATIAKERSETHNPSTYPETDHQDKVLNRVNARKVLSGNGSKLEITEEF